MDLYSDMLLPAVEEGTRTSGRDAAAINKMIEQDFVRYRP